MLKIMFLVTTAFLQDHHLCLANSTIDPDRACDGIEYGEKRQDYNFFLLLRWVVRI
jgi:hypothetical protein